MDNGIRRGHVLGHCVAGRNGALCRDRGRRRNDNDVDDGVNLARRDIMLDASAVCLADANADADAETVADDATPANATSEVLP